MKRYFFKQKETVSRLFFLFAFSDSVPYLNPKYPHKRLQFFPHFRKGVLQKT